MLKARIRYFQPKRDVTGASLYAVIQSSVGEFSSEPFDDVLLSLKFESSPNCGLTFPRLSNHEEPLGDFRVQATMQGKRGIIEFTLVQTQSSLILRIDCDDDDIAIRYRDYLIGKLLLQEATAIGISLSGGGFRATLFHLGVIRLLREANYLSQVTHIFAVSGGSIMAAHLALNWTRYLGSEEEFSAAAADLIAFIKADMRGKIIRRWFLGWMLFWIPFLRRKKLNRISLLQTFYGQLFKVRDKKTSKWRPAELKDLRANYAPEKFPDPPEIYLLATAMKRGELCAFSSEGFSYENPPGKPKTFKATTLRVASAVAASSAFPPLFPPLSTRRLGLTGIAMTEAADDYLSDGGVFDNLGTRKFLWMRQQVNHELKFFLVSDAGAPFDWNVGRFNNVLSRTIRATDILMRRVGDLEFESANRKEPAFETKWIRCYIHQWIDEDSQLIEETAKDEKVQELVPLVRTDLDRFKSSEIRSLVWHGFLVARKAFTDLPTEANALRSMASAQWDPLPSEPKQDVAGIREDLKRSGRRSIGLRSWLSDWVTYALIGIPLLAATAVFAYVAHARYVVDTQRVVRETQWLRSNAAGVTIFEQLQKIVQKEATLRWFAFQIEYLPWSELEKQLNKDEYSDERYAVIIDRLKNVDGGGTSRVDVPISQLIDMSTGKVTWTGGIKALEIPSKGTIKSRIDLNFLGQSVDANTMNLTFTQSYSGEDIQGDKSVPAQAPNSFKVQLKKDDKTGSYSGPVPHPDLNGMTVGIVTFTPRSPSPARIPVRADRDT